MYVVNNNSNPSGRVPTRKRVIVVVVRAVSLKTLCPQQTGPGGSDHSSDERVIIRSFLPFSFHDDVYII